MLDYEKEYQKLYYQNNKEKIKKKNMIYYETHKNNPEFREKRKKYAEKYKEICKSRRIEKKRQKQYVVYLEDKVEFLGYTNEVCEKYNWTLERLRYLAKPSAKKIKNKYKPNRRVYRVED